MSEESQRKFVKKKLEEYKKIGYVECPVLGNEKVYFNKHGANHLVRKKGVIRPLHEQVRRTSLFHHAIIILQRATVIDSYYTDTENGCIASFWAFQEIIDSIRIKVIVRQLGNGRKHFFSIMDDPL